MIFFSVCTNANSSFGTKKVERLVFHDSGNLYVYFFGEPSHKETCDSVITFVLPKNNPFFKEIYSGLLAAMHSGASVSGWVNGCQEIWGSTKTKITRVDFYPNQ